MAYDDKPSKRSSDREDSDRLMWRSEESSKDSDRRDSSSQWDGYLGMDDLDRIRRKRLAQQTK